MPIKIPDHLPAVDVLHRENIFVMTQNRATTQDIRPLRILLLNLMPKKIETETQLLRLLSPSYIRGLTLLGGEPFEPDNQRALLPLHYKAALGVARAFVMHGKGRTE